jgi:hypothetical protein
MDLLTTTEYENEYLDNESKSDNTIPLTESVMMKKAQCNKVSVNTDVTRVLHISGEIVHSIQLYTI